MQWLQKRLINIRYQSTFHMKRKIFLFFKYQIGGAYEIFNSLPRPFFGPICKFLSISLKSIDISRGQSL
jgi:hypothetical protein